MTKFGCEHVERFRSVSRRAWTQPLVPIVHNGLLPPVSNTTIMRVDLRFLFAIEQCHGVVRRCIFYGLPRQIDKNLGLGPIDIINPLRRDEHLVT